MSDRRRKRSPLRDVAGMLRSLHYAAIGTLHELLPTGLLGENDFAAMEPWALFFQAWASRAFLEQYLEHAGNAPFVPRDPGELRSLLDTFLLAKALYELAYELNNRPTWVSVPLHGLTQILSAP
jgi:maltose alpha-D-glucosyltransferase/alpha-amylase